MAVHRASPKQLSRAHTAPEAVPENQSSIPAAKAHRKRPRGRLNSVANIAIPPPHVESPTSLANPTPTSKDKPSNQKGTAAEPAPFHERGNWSQVASDFEDHDETLLKKWNEQIDTLLVFAGLFSAVVTAFNVESYRQLRLDADEASKALLITISQQLSDLPRMLPTNSVSNATSQVLAQLEAFEPGQTDVWINALWFASLVCSLIAASLGILVKQWLQRYKVEDYSMARERVRVRQYRYDGLERWSVPRIVAFLPLLLRTSLNLFFVGMIVFLRTLHLPIAIGISLLISIWFFVYFASLILPSVYSDCPYKSPEATAFYVARHFLKHGWRKTAESWNFISWGDGEEWVKCNSSYDVTILANVDKTFADRALDWLVRGCLKDLRKEQVIECVRRIISHRLRTQVDVITKWKSLDASRITRKCSEALINILLDTLERLEDRVADSSVIRTTSEWIKEALECIIYLLHCVDWGSELATFDDRLLTVLPKLMAISSPIAGLTTVVERLVIIILANRPVPRRAPMALDAVLPRLFSMASILFHRHEDVILPVKVAAAMLSLTSFMPTEALDLSSLLSFVDSCDVALSSFDLMPGTNESIRHGVRLRLETCRSKVKELEIRKPGVTGNLSSTIEVCIVRVDTAQTTQDGESP